MAQLLDQLYLPVYLRTLLVNTIGSFNIYFKVKENKMVLYHSGGGQFTGEVRSKLLDNNVSIVYIKKEDKDHYTEYLEKNFARILSDPELESEKKAEIAHISVLNIAKELFKEPHAKTIALYKSSINTMMDFVLEDDEAINNLIRLTSYDFTTYTHSVNVGVFGIGLAKVLFAKDPQHDMKEIASGFFLHDLGKCKIPLDILNKRGMLTNDEWKIMKKHPDFGYILLGQFNALTEEAKVIVMQHHERNDGKGYPKGLKGDQIHTYSKVCCIADVFEALTAKRPYKQKQSAFEALKIMQKDMRENFDPYYFEQFIMLFSAQNLAPSDKRFVNTFTS